MKGQYPNPYNCGYMTASMKFKRIPPNGPGQKTEEWRREHALEMKLALQSIARYPHKRDDELGYTGCRNIAKAALNRNA